MSQFQNIIGHKAIIEHLQDAIEMKKISHAYIFEGEKGSGKKAIADAFSTALECEKKEKDSCGVCHSCVRANSHSHPDIIWVEHEKENIISVDEVRKKINHDIMMKPYSGPYKIYIVDEAEKLNEQAQNALLKTIEEPPEYAVIILLTTNAGIFLPTIISRCITLHFKPVEYKEVEKYILDHVDMDPDKVKFLVKYSMGNIGKAMRLAQSEEFDEMRKDCVHLLRYMNDMTEYEVIEYMKNLSKYKLEMTEFLDMMMLWYRDVLMLKATGNIDQIIFMEEYGKLKEQAIYKSYEQINNILKAFEVAKTRLRANVNFDTTIELLLWDIKEN
ncbi:MAG: DNA polymerase III subunit delta' [Lachnospiraceae bacterium]